MAEQIPPPTPLRNISRSRNALNAPLVKGRFCKYKPETAATKLKAAKRKAYNVRRERLSARIYDKYVSLFFLKGAENDCIPGSSCAGPVVELAEALLKASFRPTRAIRSHNHKLQFFGGKKSDIKPPKTITCRDAARKSSKVLQFEGRRLPHLANQILEIDPLREWLNELQSIGALRCKSVDEAFAICLDTIKNYIVISGKPSYGFPMKFSASTSPVEAPIEDPGSSSNIPSSPATTNAHDMSPRLDAERMTEDQVEESETRDELKKTLKHMKNILRTGRTPLTS